MDKPQTTEQYVLKKHPENIFSKARKGTVTSSKQPNIPLQMPRRKWVSSKSYIRSTPLLLLRLLLLPPDGRGQERICISGKRCYILDTESQEFTYLLLAQKNIQDSPMVVSLELNTEWEGCLVPRYFFNSMIRVRYSTHPDFWMGWK